MDEKRGELKREYEKPRLRVIELAAEEVMGIGCKISSGAPGVQPTGVCGNPVCSADVGS